MDSELPILIVLAFALDIININICVIYSNLSRCINWAVYFNCPAEVAGISSSILIQIQVRIRIRILRILFWALLQKSKKDQNRHPPPKWKRTQSHEDNLGEGGGYKSQLGKIAQRVRLFQFCLAHIFSFIESHTSPGEKRKYKNLDTPRSRAKGIQ